jgi:D-alanyl-D-alanine carboxypeptidase (penicillin-binding protein 5/6)
MDLPVPYARPRMKMSCRALVILTILLTITPGTPALAGAAPRAAAPSPTAPPGPDANPLPAPLGVAEGILVDPANGKVLWSENDTVPRAPASLTKIATAMVVLQRGDLNAVATVTPDAAAVGGSETFVPAGTTMTVEDMLWGLLVVSGNDMAVALAHAISPDGTVAGFAALMNQDAAAVGATSSNFVNPHGLDAPGHVSSARDLALLTMVDMRNPLFAQMVGTVSHAVTWGGKPQLLINHNKLLTLFPGAIGVKTGYTNDAGWALDSEVTRNGRTLLAVVMGATSPAGYGDSEALYNWGFANLDTLEAQATDRLAPGSVPPVAPPAAAGTGGHPAKTVDQRAVAAGGRPMDARHPLSLNEAIFAVFLASLLAAGFLKLRRQGT